MSKLLRYALVAFALVVMVPEAIGATSDDFKAVKRDSRYIYGEATRLDEAEAQEEAVICLVQYVNDYLVNEGIDKRFIPQQLTGVNFMSMEKKNGIRVLAYVEKSVVEGKGSTAAEAKPATEEMSAPAAKPAPATKPAPEPVYTPEPVSEPETVYEPQPEPVRESVPEPVAQPQQQMSTAIATLPTANRHVSTPAAQSGDWRKAVVYEVIGSGNVEEAWDALDVFRAQGKVRRFGVPADVRHPDESHWLICDDQGSVITVLGPIDSTDRRHDYVSGEFKTLRDYPDALMLWFELK